MIQYNRRVYPWPATTSVENTILLRYLNQDNMQRLEEYKDWVCSDIFYICELQWLVVMHTYNSVPTTVYNVTTKLIAPQ